MKLRTLYLTHVTLIDVNLLLKRKFTYLASSYLWVFRVHHLTRKVFPTPHCYAIRSNRGVPYPYEMFGNVVLRHPVQIYVFSSPHSTSCFSSRLAAKLWLQKIVSICALTKYMDSVSYFTFERIVPSCSSGLTLRFRNHRKLYSLVTLNNRFHS